MTCPIAHWEQSVWGPQVTDMEVTGSCLYHLAHELIDTDGQHYP